MPRRCAPCPGKRKARRPVPAVPRSTPGAVRPAASSARPRAASAWSAAITRARSSWTARVVARARPRSARAPARSSSRSAGGLRGPCSRAVARSRSACSVLPDSGSGSGAPGRASGVGSVDCSAGASSTITWALVPLTPKEETPARRGSSPLSQGRASVRSSTPPSDQSTWGVRSSTCSVFGSVPCRMAMIILMTPAAPAAAWACPMFDFTDPSHRGCSAGRCCP